MVDGPRLPKTICMRVTKGFEFVSFFTKKRFVMSVDYKMEINSF